MNKKERAAEVAIIAVLAALAVVLLAFAPHRAQAALWIPMPALYGTSMPPMAVQKTADAPSIKAAAAPKKDPVEATKNHLTRVQIRAILDLLIAFGADARVILNAADAMGAY